MSIKATNIGRGPETMMFDAQTRTVAPGQSIEVSAVFARTLQDREEWRIDYSDRQGPTYRDHWIGYASALNTWTGYGKQGYQIFQAMTQSHLNVVYHDMARFGVPRPMKDQLDQETAALVEREDYCIPEWGLLHHVVDPITEMPNRRRIAWSMWEADRLPVGGPGSNVGFNHWAQKINESAEALIVPATEQRRIFQRSGVTVPVHVVHDGIKTDFWSYQRPRGPQGRPFTFMMWAYMNSRKAPWQVLNSFVSAFGPNNPHVRLVMKTVDFQFGGGIAAGIPQINFTNNVEIINEPWTEVQLRDYVRTNCDVAFFGSHGEGFYDPPLEALSMGIPVIAVDHSGAHDFADSRYLYPIPLKGMQHAPQGGAEHLPACQGQPAIPADVADACPGTHWWIPDWDQAVGLMREVYGNYDAALAKAEKGSAWVKKRWSVEHQRTDLMQALNQICR